MTGSNLTNEKIAETLEFPRLFGRADMVGLTMVGLTGFEPATPCEFAISSPEFEEPSIFQPTV